MIKGKINRNSAAILLIDLQEGLLPAIAEKEKIINNVNKLIRGAGVLNVPIVVTEQYPKGLKQTSKEIKLPGDFRPIEKNCFSCFLNRDITAKLESLNVKSVLIAGLETHICVFKTALDSLEWGFETHVISDAVGSRTAENKTIALERMRDAGVFISSVEMALFQMIDFSGDDEFKSISAIIR